MMMTMMIIISEETDSRDRNLTSNFCLHPPYDMETAREQSEALISKKKKANMADRNAKLSTKTNILYGI
jgi:hypothetical protein